MLKFKQFIEINENTLTEEDILEIQLLNITEELLSESTGNVIDAEDHPLYKKRTEDDIKLHSPEKVINALKGDATSVRIMSKKDDPKHGDLVGARLNINVLKNTSKKDIDGKPILSTGIPILTLHKNTNTSQYKRGQGFYKGEARAYQQVATLNNAHFNVHQKGREAIATGKMNKHPMASVDGNYDAKAKPNFDGVEARFNPMDHHLFVDNNGHAIRSAEHVTLHGHRAYLRGKIEYHTPETAPKRAGDAPSKTAFKPE